MPTTHRRHTCQAQKPQLVREAKAPCLRQATLQYPSLHFEAHAIKGQANQIAHPIYLPALAIGPDSAKQVGGNEDVILTLPGLEGFKMIVKANSVTFPDGSRQGLLVISPVTADKLPMAPPAGGAQFGVPAWTIQPSGTRFDPPIEVHMPNATGEIAGDNLPVVQWDHDLSQYVPMGRATVSGDGAILITDAGSGITKAGWGGLCRYDECKTAIPGKGCGDCKKVEYKGNPPCPNCVPDPAKNFTYCENRKDGTCGDCQEGTCFANTKKNEGDCCGGKIIDPDKQCCVKLKDQGQYITVEKGKPIEEAGNLPPDSYPNRAQFEGPPSGTDPRFSVSIGGITYEIDGCSVPGALQSTFPEKLFVQTGSLQSSNPMALPFYEACKQHDICYQTCRSDQNTCDQALNSRLVAYCQTLPVDKAGSGYYLGQQNQRDECMMNANKVYAGLIAGGFVAHRKRQQQMCVGCPK